MLARWFSRADKGQRRNLNRCRPLVEELEPRLVLSSNTIAWDGGNWFLAGVNYPWHSYAADFGTGGWGHLANYTAVQSDMQTLAGEGVHLVRWWVFGDGRYDPLFNAQGQVTGLDAQFFTDLDTELQYAANNHIYLDLTLLDQAIANSDQYVNGVQLGGHAAVITDPATQQSYLDNALMPLLQHIAASPYRNAVLAYDIINEPEYDMVGFGGGATIDPNLMKTFVQNCATYIHAYGGGAYATVGSATPYWVNTWVGLGLDFYAIHYYPWMDFSNGAGSGLPSYASLGLDKPAIIEEFATNDGSGSYGLTDNNPLSAEWYVNSIYNLGYAGGLGWSYGAGDSESNWSAFEPVYYNWAQTHAALVGPQPLSAPPAIPTHLVATAGNTRVVLTWTAAAGAASYDIYRGASSGGENATPLATGITSANFTDTSLTNGTAYFYEVSAVNAGGQSGQSNESSATPQVAIPLGTSPPAIYVESIYGLLLGRTPDPGATYWVNALNTGTSPASVVQTIEGSTEYRADEVTALYLYYLQRSPDAGGEQAWVSLLAGGGTIEQVIDGLVGAPEFFALQGGTNTGFVQALYQDILGRPADAGGEAGWLQALANGASRSDVAAAFLGSLEYKDDLVESDYRQYLGRTADAGGLAGWVQALQTGLSDQVVRAAILGSAEGYAKWS